MSPLGDRSSDVHRGAAGRAYCVGSTGAGPGRGASALGKESDASEKSDAPSDKTEEGSVHIGAERLGGSGK